VLKLVGDGLSHKQIAGELGISIRTVEFHKYQIMEHLNIHGTADLIKYAVKNRISN
jgi:DNA-binding NarL/FixJ family response regulator